MGKVTRKSVATKGVRPTLPYTLRKSQHQQQQKEQPQKAISSWLGIDLGTTNTTVAIVKNGKVEILCNSDNNANSVSKSCVAFEGNQIIVGNQAAERKIQRPESTIYEAKRVIGLPFYDADGRINAQISRFMERVPFKVFPRDGFPCFEVPYEGVMHPVRPQDIGAKLLTKMRALAETSVNGCSGAERIEFRRAVITVPAGFSQEQKLATEEAGKLAGFEEVHLITEPAAAAYAYGFQHNRRDGYKVLVYDFGGGTFDLSILDVRDGEFRVLVNGGGDRWLGGSDLDQLLMRHCAERIRAVYGANAERLNAERAKQCLLQRCEAMKKRLSVREEDEISLDFIAINEAFPVTRAEFEQLCLPLLQKTMDLTETAMRDAGLSADQIDEVLLVGGTSNIPMVRKLLETKLGFSPAKLNRSVNAMHSVAQGAAILGAQLDEITRDQMPTMQLLESIPLSIGIALSGNKFVPLFARHTNFPCKCTENIFTGTNDQLSMPFHIYEGERKLASENRLLGKFALYQLSKGAAGEVRVKLELEIDRNGILHAIATHGDHVARLNIGYRCDNPRILELCDQHNGWLKQNRDAIKSAFRDKLEEFNAKLDEIKIQSENDYGESEEEDEEIEGVEGSEKED